MYIWLKGHKFCQDVNQKGRYKAKAVECIRSVLLLEIQSPLSDSSFFLLVHHLDSGIHRHHHPL